MPHAAVDRNKRVTIPAARITAVNPTERTLPDNTFANIVNTP